MAYLTPPPKVQFFDANGAPLVAGKLYTYEAGTLTPKTTYVDQAQSSTNTNPVILDSRGEANVWLSTTGLYKWILKDSADATIWTVDNIGYNVYNQGIEIDIASATTTDIGAQNSCFLRVTGTNTITSLGTNYNGPRYLRFAGALQLTYNSSTLILPGAANLTTSAGAVGIFVPKATSGTPDGWYLASYLSLIPVSANQLQSQVYKAYTTAGTSTAFTLTTNAVLTAITTNEEWDVTFNAAAGTTPTLNRDSLGAKNLKYRDSTGAKQAVTSTQIPSGWRSKVVYDGTDYIVREIPSTTFEWQKLESSIFSAASSLSLILTSYSGYRDIKIVLTGVSMGTNGSGIAMQFSSNGGSSYDGGATDYQYADTYSTAGAAGANIGSTGDVSMLVCVGGSNVTNLLSDVEVQIYGANDAAKRTRSRWYFNYFNNVGDIAHGGGSGYRANAQITNAVRFIPGSGVFTGKYAIYGRN